MNLLIGTYNNYFNRVHKIPGAGNLEDYQDAMEALSDSPLPVTVTNINFNPADGIVTNLVLGKGSINEPEFIDWDIMAPDYLVAYGDDDAIISRWFILNVNRTRSGQYDLQLRRDVISDHIDAVLDATTYIEKGYIPVGNNLLFNKEGMLFNQIKKSEEQLRDASNCAWLVGYIAKSASIGSTTINYAPERQNFEEVSAANITSWFQQWGIGVGQPFLADPYDITYRVSWQAGENFVYNYAARSFIYGNGWYSWEKFTRGSIGNETLRAPWSADRKDTTIKIFDACCKYGLATFKSALISLVGAHSSAEVTSIKNYNGKIIKTQDGKYYRIRVETAPTVYSAKNVAINSGSDLFNLLNSACQISGAFASSHNTGDNTSFTYSFNCSQYIVSYAEDHSYEVTSQISSSRNKTRDAIYDIIALPYPLNGETVNIHNSSGTVNIDVSNIVSMAAITSLATALGGGGTASSIYDIQLLPYCPIQTMIDNQGILIDDTKEHVDFDFINDNSTDPVSKIGALFYCSNSQFTFDIDKSVYWDEYKYISGFTDIDVLPLPYSTFKQNVPYVIPSMANPTGVGTMQTAIRAMRNSKYVNEITCNKIDKVTGEIIDTVLVNSLVVTFNAGSTRNHLDCNVVTYLGGSAGWYVPDGTWSWNDQEYANADYYLEFTLNTDSWGGSNINELLAKVAKIPVYGNLIDSNVAMKIDNECKLYRIVSPNYQGDFEFSPVKNGGVDRFNVDCTYKPFNPYIHVNPDFGGLYGDDFNDSRGLICQGDFTVGMISDAFTNYELQNKNYQQIFNRQIQNMDVSNEIARQEQAFKSITGTVTGAASGAVAGAMVGGGYGAIAGAVVGLAAGATGGIMDYNNLDKQLRENKNYAIDMYNFNLQNIKALPYTITRCTALTYNNKLFPFIEMYDCTEEEKQAFIHKLKYDGMTVNAIGKISDYTDMAGRLVRGEVIRYDESDNVLKEDLHLANEIYNEIKKGVYI